MFLSLLGGHKNDKRDRESVIDRQAFKRYFNLGESLQTQHKLKRMPGGSMRRRRLTIRGYHCKGYC